MNIRMTILSAFIIVGIVGVLYAYCDGNPWNEEPCNCEYWNYMRTNSQCENYHVSPGNPLDVAPYPYATPSSNMLYRDGNILMRGKGYQEELVFLKGVGEYKVTLLYTARKFTGHRTWNFRPVVFDA